MPVSSTVKTAKKFKPEIYFPRGEVVQNGIMVTQYVDRIPVYLSQGVFIQECPSEHQQVGSPLMVQRVKGKRREKKNSQKRL